MPKVLIATDGSAPAIGAARRGVELLDPKSELTVLRVMPAISAITGIAATTDFIADAVADPLDIDQATADAKADVDATLAAIGRHAETRIEQGDPADTICDVARRDKFDLVLLGSHGSGVLKRALVGSVSHHVLHHADCAVLVIREPEPATE